MKVKNYYLATIIHTGEPINVGFALEFDGTERNPQAKVLAGARYSLQERLTKLGRDPEAAAIAENLNIQNMTVVLSVQQ